MVAAHTAPHPARHVLQSPFSLRLRTRCNWQLADMLPGGQMNFPPRARHLVQTVAADQVHQCTPVLGARP